MTRIEDMAKYSGAPGADPASTLAPLIAAIGTDGFVDALMAFAALEVAAHFVSVFCIADTGTPLLIGTACTVGAHRAQLAARGYRQHFPEDPNYGLLHGDGGAGGDGNGDGGDFLTFQNMADIASFTYRRDCYERPGICDRISAIRRAQGYGLSVSLYRSLEAGPFEIELREKAVARLGLLLAATERHAAFRQRREGGGQSDHLTWLALNHPALTRREREVAALTLEGETAAQIAGRLGLSETTIITHRKNAYRRMKVRGHKELMALLFSARS